MTEKTTIDKAGRIVIPKPLREELRLSPGDELQLDSSGEEITLHPVRETAQLKKERGFWVYRSGRSLKNLSINDWIDSGREERIRRAMG